MNEPLDKLKLPKRPTLPRGGIFMRAIKTPKEEAVADVPVQYPDVELFYAFDRDALEKHASESVAKNGYPVISAPKAILIEHEQQQFRLWVLPVLRP